MWASVKSDVGEQVPKDAQFEPPDLVNWLIRLPWLRVADPPWGGKA